ncbi:hypothetical protein BEN51_02775 [Clostridium isatidis]|uniref:DUF2922 domain-containing protein n=2 Tax=Clostridium isatidis TaxID=182773 RepID=A0A343JFY1_9CLOT|nr:hypothetical protein BEN51_02775 [Clostridium isatidis]
MEFKDAFGKKYTLSIKDVKEELKDADILALMNGILVNNLISTENGSLVEKVSANVITKETTEVEI